MVLTEYWTDSPKMFSLEAWLLPLELYEICCLLKVFSIEYPVLLRLTVNWTADY